MKYVEGTNRYQPTMLPPILDDYVDEWFFNFGGEFPAEYVDEDKLAESILDSDGRGNSLSFYDGNEYYCEIDDNEYFIYID